MNRLSAHYPAQPNLDVSSTIQTWSIQFWLMTIVTGMAAGITGGILMRLLRLVEHTAWNYHEGSLAEAAMQAPASRHLLILSATGLLVGVGSHWIRKTLGEPGEADTAIWFRSGRMPVLSTLAQAVHSIVAVGLGTSLGRESPIKQSGGAIASQIARWRGFSRPEQRLLVACGVGAGMASAYNVPVGGALFAVEVLLGSLSLRLALPALLCSGVATASSWLLLPMVPVYDVPEYPLSLQLIVWSIIAGPLLGLATIPLVRAIDWAQTHKPRRGFSVYITPIVAFTVFAALTVPFPHLLGNGKDAVQVAFADQFPVEILLVLPVLKLLATSGCLASGASGGLFTPTMTIGALLGGLLGHAWNSIWPGASMGSCSVIGSTAFLAAATQGPVSALVLVLELTRHVDATMVPMLLAVVGAMLVARRIETRSIYSMRVRVKQETPTQEMIKSLPGPEHLRREFTTISAAAAYGQGVRLLLLLPPESTIYVLGRDGELVGKMDAHCTHAARLCGMPLDAAKVADVADPVEALKTNMTRQEWSILLAGSKASELPVVDAATGLMLGVISTPESWAGNRPENR